MYSGIVIIPDAIYTGTNTHPSRINMNMPCEAENDMISLLCGNYASTITLPCLKCNPVYVTWLESNSIQTVSLLCHWLSSQLGNWAGNCGAQTSISQFTFSTKNNYVNMYFIHVFEVVLTRFADDGIYFNSFSADVASIYLIEAWINTCMANMWIGYIKIHRTYVYVQSILTVLSRCPLLIVVQ